MQNEKNIFANKIFAEIFNVFIFDKAGTVENSYLAFAAVEFCNVIALALVILQDGEVNLNDIIQYDLQGKVLALKKQLMESDNPDKDNIIFLLGIIMSVPIGYFSDVFDFIKNKINSGKSSKVIHR